MTQSTTNATRCGSSSASLTGVVNPEGVELFKLDKERVRHGTDRTVYIAADASASGAYNRCTDMRAGRGVPEVGVGG